jgi:transposase-like protein
MALKQDERALLQLVCERGQTYADLAELLGVSESQVRERARAALAELGGADPDTEVDLTDYLLGQADPIGRADAVRHLQQDRDARDLAETILTKLAAIAPSAQLPKLPAAKGGRRPAAATPAEVRVTAEPAGSSPRPSGRSTLIAGLAAGGVIVVFAMLAVFGVFSSDDSPQASGGDGTAPDGGVITPVELSAEGGSGVAGTADFGLGADQLYVDLSLDGLDPTPSGNAVYVLWLMLTQNDGYPVSIIVPNENGGVEQRYDIPAAALAIAGAARFVRVSASPSKALQDDIAQAVSGGAPLVPLSGETLAQGRIPLADRGGNGNGPGGGDGAGGNGGG